MDFECHEGSLPPEAEAIRAGLLAYNQSKLENAARLPLCLLHRDAEGRVVGGLVGEVALRWLFVDKFWLDESLRGQGLGSALLRAAEARAEAQGAIGAHLYTSSHQAPDFYRKLGYTVIGHLSHRPPGQTRFWLARRFDGAPVSEPL